MTLLFDRSITGSMVGKTVMWGSITLFAHLANGGAVNTGEVNTFSASTPAISSDVNDNFALLIAALNDSAQRIEILEENNSTSEDNQSLENKLAGGSYRLISIENFLNKRTTEGDETVEIASSTFLVTVTFNENGSVTMSEGTTKGRTIRFSPDPSCCDDDIDEVGPPDTSHTWEVSGSTLILTSPEDGATPFTVSPDANILVNTEPGDFFDFDEAGTASSEFKTSLGILIRIN